MEGTMMVVVTDRFKVNSGYEAMFEELFLHRAHLLESMPGFCRWELHRPLGDGWYASVTYWERCEHHEAWQRCQAFQAAHEEKLPRGMCAATSALEMSEVVQSSCSPRAFLDALGDVRRDDHEVT
jgi:heme-degrading monooxygenase HmoA